MRSRLIRLPNQSIARLSITAACRIGWRPRRKLADRLHGKPIQAIDIDDERPNVPVFIMPEDTHIAIK